MANQQPAGGWTYVDPDEGQHTYVGENDPQQATEYFKSMSGGAYTTPRMSDVAHSEIGMAKQFAASTLKGTATLSGQLLGKPDLRDDVKAKVQSQMADPGWSGKLSRLLSYVDDPTHAYWNPGKAEQAMSSATGGFSERQPQNTLEEYARTLGSFLPNVAATSAGSLPAFLFDATVPALSSEGAGQFARKYLPDISQNEYVKQYAPWMPSTESIARFFGAVGGGPAVSKVISPNKGAMTAEQFNDAAKQRVNIGGDTGIGQATRAPLTLEDAYRQAGDEFQRLTNGHDVPFDNTLVNNVNGHYRRYFGAVPPNSRAPTLTDMVDNLQNDAAAGTISGPTYQNYVEQLRHLSIHGATGSDKAAAIGIRRSLDDAMERGLAVNSPADVGAFRDVRNNYRDVSTLIDAEAAANGGPFTPNQLSAAVKRHAGKNAFVFNQNDLGNLAKNTQIVKTTDFKMPTNPYVGAILPSAAGLASQHFFGGDFPGIVPGGVGGAAFVGTGAAQHLAKGTIENLLSSPAGVKYRFNQIMPRTPLSGGLIGNMLGGGR